MNLAVFILGFIGMTVQAAYLREMLAVFRGGELLIGAALFFWLLWTSIGSGPLGRAVSGLAPPRMLFHALLPLYALFGHAGVTVISRIHVIAGLTPGRAVPYDMQFLAAAAACLPFALAGGVLFTVGVKSVELSRPSMPAGRAYVLESFGAAAGGAVFSLVLIVLFDNALIVSACPAIAVLYSSMACAGRGKGLLFAIIVPPLLFGGVLFMWRGATAGYQYRGQTLLEQRDTRYGRLRVTETGEQVTFYSGAGVLFSKPDRETAEYAVHIPLLAAPDSPGTTLVLGGGPGGILDEVLKYRSVERIVCVEIDPALFSMARHHLNERWRDDPRVDLRFTDGRAFLENTGERFDAIVMNMPPPVSGQANRYYTREFFQLVSLRLADDGVFSFALAGGENYIPPDLAGYLACIRKTLADVFPSVAVLPGTQTRFLAGNTPGLYDDPDWERIAENRRSRGIETLYVRDYFLRFNYSPMRVAYVRDILDGVPQPFMNTDTRPVAYFLRTVVEGTEDGSVLVESMKKAIRPGLLYVFLGTFVAASLLPVLIPWHGRRYRHVQAAIITVGLTEMCLQVLAIMAYQFVFGHLFGRIALLAGSYMAGLGLGALWGMRRIENRGAASGLLARLQAAMGLLALVWLLVLAGHTALPAGIPGLEAMFFVLAALGGVAGGFQFTVADTLHRTLNAGRRTGSGAVYALDLAGSSFGALAFGPILVPVLGMMPVLVFLAVLNFTVAAGIAIRLR